MTEKNTDNKTGVTSAYIGSGKVDCYEIIMLPDMDTDYVRDETLKKASNNAVMAALNHAYSAASGQPYQQGYYNNNSAAFSGGGPDCGNAICTLSISLSSPHEGKPITDSVAKVGLPPGALQLVQQLKPEAKYRILSISITWTARWVCLPEGSVLFSSSNNMGSGGEKTFIGDQVFDFGTPQPSNNKVINLERKYFQSEGRKKKTDNFKAGLENELNQMKHSLNSQLFQELQSAIRLLPQCPVEKETGGISITIGYPKPYAVNYKEKKYQVAEREMMRVGDPPEYKYVDSMVDNFDYTIYGEWSWSVQRNCKK